MDDTYDEFELVLVQLSQSTTTAYRVGVYSTNSTKLSFDSIDETWPQIEPGDVALTIPIMEKSDGIYEVGKYQLRVGPTSRFDFNYQPLANQIKAHWVIAEYDKKYYKTGGTNISYMRDEVYAYFSGAVAGSRFVISREATGGAEIELESDGDINLNRTGNGGVLIGGLGNYADDAAAAAGGVPINGLYRNGNNIQIRIV